MYCCSQGQFRQPTCAWDSTFSFEACCATGKFEVDGQPCEAGDTTYANCCAPPSWWCGNDPSFVDGGGFTCADWATGQYSCTDDTAGYSRGDRSALWAACPAACGMCQSENWQGVWECWSGDFEYSSCCTGDADGDGVPGDSNCWTESHNFDTCKCNEPIEPVCDATQLMLRPGGSDTFVLSVTACGYGPGLPSASPHGLCVWDELWGNGYCDQSPGAPSYNPAPEGPWYYAWQADLNCEQAGFGELHLNCA